MATQTTPTAPKAWAPDVTAYLPSDVIPAALVLQASTIAGAIEGDEPQVRVPFVRDDGDYAFVAEAATIPDADQEFDETTISTFKAAAVGKYSAELLAQPQAAQMIVESLQRGVTKKANRAFVANASGPIGLLHVGGITDAGEITTDLDPVVSAVADIEAEDGTASVIIAAPSAWGDLSVLKTAADSNQSLVGAGVEAATRSILGIPVLVSNAMPAGTLLIVDRSTVISAVGPLRIVRSDDAYFAQDISGIRVTWRFGWGVQRPERIAKLTTASAEGS